MSKKLLSIAVTGGIGSGKSLALKEIEKHRFQVIYADHLGHEMLHHNDVKEELITIFGEEILTVAAIDRRKLGRIVFNDKSRLQQLNNVLHPRICEQIENIICTSKERVLFFEVPLLFEEGIEAMFSLTVNIAANPQLRKERIIARDQYLSDDVEKRIKAQLSEETRKQRASITIQNECTEDCFLEKIRLLINLINLPLSVR